MTILNPRLSQVYGRHWTSFSIEPVCFILVLFLECGNNLLYTPQKKLIQIFGQNSQCIKNGRIRVEVQSRNLYFFSLDNCLINNGLILRLVMAKEFNNWDTSDMERVIKKKT